MTTVAAIAADGIVYMAADSLVNVYERPVPSGVPKILRLTAGGEEYLIGCSGAGAMPGLLAADLPEALRQLGPAGTPHAWATTVARAITGIAGANGILAEGRMDAHLILGWRGEVWSINHQLAVAHADGIAAIGSGEGPAIGAIDAFLSLDVTPADALRRALRIAVRRDRYSGLPIVVERLPPRC